MKTLAAAVLALAISAVPAVAQDKALGLAMVIAAGRECPGVIVDLDAIARLIAAESALDSRFEERVMGGLLEGAVLRLRAAEDRGAHCASMAKVIADAGLDG